jgi:hypothetical protein
MDVSIIFEPNFHGETGPAVWIINTPSNRAWFEGRQGLDPGSAVFSNVEIPVADEDVVQTIWTAQQHHFDWQNINVYGHTLSSILRDHLADEGLLIPTQNGFVVSRN